MTSKNLWAKRAAVAVAALAVLGSASPAMATIAASNDGVTVTTNSAETKVTVKDTDWDGFSVNGDFYANGDADMHTINVSGGNNDEVTSGTYSDGIRKLRGCVVKPIVKDACTGWYS